MPVTQELILICLLFPLVIFSQTTQDSSVLVDFSANDKGILIPRLSSQERMSLPDPARGLLVYDKGASSFYYFDGLTWVRIVGGDDNDWERNKMTVYNDSDSIAIGRTTSNTDFHIDSNKNVLFGDSLSGSGFKFLWNSQKGALRFGHLTNPFAGYNYDRFWDHDSIGYYSFAGGQNSRAKGFGSFAFGSFGWADGSGSVAFFGNAKGNQSYTFGGNSQGRGSFTVEGTAVEEGGIAMYGYTGGRYGVSIGGGTTGLGASSARQDYAVAIGWNADARGQASIALGPSDAYGYNSFSTGWITEARGNYSSTFGYRTNAYPYASFALGRYNLISGDSASWIASDPIFIIGDGTSNSNRSNSFLIQKNGQTAVGYNNPIGMLNVSTSLGNINNNGTLDPSRASVMIGNTSTGMAFDANQIETIGSSLNLNYLSSSDLTLVRGGGNVSIGHASPSTKLDVLSSGWQLRVANGDSGGQEWYVGSSANGWASGGGKFVISPTSNSGSSALAITNSSKMGIGTTNPSDKLHISAAADESALRVQIGGTTRFRVHSNGGISLGANVTPPISGLYVSGETEFDGDVRPDNDNSYDLGSSSQRWRTVYSANGVSQLSDGRLKTDIVPIEYGIDEVMKLRPVSYTWKNREQSLPKLGLIAQEIYPVIPEVVEGSPNQEIPMGINYSEIVPLLIQAIKEQQVQIEYLNTELKKLRTK